MSPVKIVVSAVAVFGVLILLFSSAVTIETQEKGVVTRFGAIQRVVDEGFHFVNPFTTKVVKMDISVQALRVSEYAYSRDSQVVAIEAVVNYRLISSDVVKVFQDVRRDYESRYVLPESRDALKAVLSNYTAQQLIENRPKLPLEIAERLTSELSDKGILVTNISLENFDFDDAYENAVQNKQVQEQQALAQVNITKQEEEKKKQEILKAEALSEKTRLEAQALASQNGSAVIEKIYAEAQLEASKRWNGILPTHMYGSAPIPLLNLGQ